MMNTHKEISEEIGKQYPDYIVRNELLRRGWCEELIDGFVQPDLVVQNPHQPTQKMRLYRKETIFETEKSHEFKKAFLTLNQETLNIKKFVCATTTLKKEHKASNRQNKARRLREKKDFGFLDELLASGTK